MNELSLFTGAGGGLLGTKLLGWNHIGYIEKDEYCQKVIAQRIKDGFLDEAPIFSDIKTFINDGYAESYSGMVDVITAGFPCQPFSCAGKQKGKDDDQNMWPETIRAIRLVGPRFALLENVPGLLANEYARTIFGDLAESGYDCRWRILSAAELGAQHKRDRLWIVANAEEYLRGSSKHDGPKASDGCGADVAHSNEAGLEGRECEELRERSGERVAGASGASDVADAEGAERQGFRRETRGRRTELGCGGWWTTEPGLGRVVDELADWLVKLGKDGQK